jgi:hypothetical protein
MKHLKLFENFTLTDLEQQYQEAQYLYKLGIIDRTGLRYVEDQLKLERYIADGSKGGLGLTGTPIQSLGELTRVGGDLDLYGTGIQSLGELREVGGDLDLRGTPIQSLGELREVGGTLNLRGTRIQSLGELREVGGNLNLRGTPIKSLGELTQVGRYLYLIDTPISKTHTEREIKAMVRVRGQVLL